jgi:hypothetical protein
MKSLRLGVLICALSALPLATASTVFSENFDELTPGPNQTSAGSFSVTMGNIDIVGGDNGSFFPALCVSPASGNCLDMDGNTPGALESGPLALVAGTTYTLSFDLLGSQRGNSAATEVTLGTSGCSGAGCLYDMVFTLPATDDTDGVVSVAITPTSNITAFLTFTSDTPGQSGDILDNVSISSVPEPATFGLLAFALAGFCVVGYRKRKAA